MGNLLVRWAVHVGITLLLPPLLLGVVTKVKALFAGRVGPPVLQPYYDLAKLARKDSVFSTTTTWVFRAGPVVALTSVLVASLLVPFGGVDAPVAFAGDLILFVYLFGLARFFTITAALDTGSAFEGMGAAREATFSCMAEPALLLSLLVLVKRTSTTSLTGMLGSALAAQWSAVGAALVLVVASLLVVVLAENCRIPFDDPNTHLELTMIHEVMVLDHSGPALGMISYGAALKLFVLGAIVVGIVLPLHTGSAVLDLAVFVAGMLVLSVVIGTVESTMARLRLRHVPSLLIGACLLSGFAVLLAAR
ncbi:MAG: respiratory chain complex I subunit 1 family protein [Polyangiaceae bacterium]